MSIFKACDVRGRYPDELGDETALRIGRAVGTVLDHGTVVVGGDVRPSTPALKAAVIDGLIASGCEVADIGIVPTPAFYFAKRELGAKGGVMVTASHNPAEYNGLKIVLGDLPITPQELDRIRSLAEMGDFAAGQGRSRTRDIIAEYEEYVARVSAAALDSLGRMPKVVLDCGNGCYSEIAPVVLRRLGVPFVSLFCESDGTFPNRSPNSALPENLRALSARVVAEQADLGVAFDGDGDRVSFADENGRILTADQVIAIVAQYANGGVRAGEKVVLDLKCSAAVSEVISRLGAEPIMEKSGHTFIKTRVIAERAALGGEISGHLFYRELSGGDDGLYSAIVMAGIVARHGLLSRLAAAVPSYATTPDLRVRISPDPALLDRIAAAFSPDRVLRLDGVRVGFDDGWALARLSVTEPVMTLRFEGRDEAALRRIIDEFLSPVPELERHVAAALGGLGPCAEALGAISNQMDAEE